MYTDTKCVRSPASQRFTRLPMWTRACIKLRDGKGIPWHVLRVIFVLPCAKSCALPALPSLLWSPLPWPIGANTAIFTLLNQALLRALPVKDPNQLVVLIMRVAEKGTRNLRRRQPRPRPLFFLPDVRDLRDNSKVFSGLAAAAPANAGVSWNNRAEQVPVEMVSGNYFQTLGVQPAAGRLLLPSDETTDKANPVVVLSFDYWTSRLAQTAVVGKTLLINGYLFNIVGLQRQVFTPWLGGIPMSTFPSPCRQ